LHDAIVQQQVGVTPNHENGDVRDIGTGEARDRKYKMFKLDGGEPYNRSSH
jgi:hypothetical protein